MPRPKARGKTVIMPARTANLARVAILLDRAMFDAIATAAGMLRLTRSAVLAEAAGNEIEGPR